MIRTLIAGAVITFLFAWHTNELKNRRMGSLEYLLLQVGLTLFALFIFSDKFANEVSTSFGFTLPSNFLFTFILFTFFIMLRIQGRSTALLKRDMQELVEKIAIHER